MNYFWTSFLWKHQCLCFHYWDYLMNIWRNIWQSIIDVVENLGFCVVLLIFVPLIGIYLTSISKNLVMLKTMQMIKTGIKYFKTRFLNALESFIVWKENQVCCYIHTLCWCDLVCYSLIYVKIIKLFST